MKTKYQSAFTLIELLIVIGLIALLGALATAYFGDNVTKAHCTEGRTALLTAASTLEKCKAVYGIYDDAGCNMADFLGDTPDEHFNVTMNRTATTFDLTATGLGSAAAAENTFCSEITLNHLGVQDGTVSSPW